MLDDGLETETSKQQRELECKVQDIFASMEFAQEQEDVLQQEDLLCLLRTSHIKYLHGGLGELSSSFAALDASRPWICYWILHSLAMLDAPLPTNIAAEDVVCFLSSCRAPDGGYSGGPGQLAHLAPTYAAVAALVTLGTDEALASIDRSAMRAYLLKMAIGSSQGGGFYIHEGGEADVRACYCALAVAHMLHLDMQELLDASGAVDYVVRCQTYEGGLGGEPGNEAHGGYTFCGLAALVLTGRADALDLPRLLHWASARQSWVEGGFNGRTNKLADGCYSFWQGSLFGLLQQLDQKQLGVMQAGPVACELAACRGDNPLLRLDIKPPLPPQEQADRQWEAQHVSQQAARMQALAASEQVHAALETSTQRVTAAASAAARALMDEAHRTQQALDAAQHSRGLVPFSAAHICSQLERPLPAAVGLLGSGSGTGQDAQAAGMDASTRQLLEASCAAAPLQQRSSCLMDSPALQLWLLCCCQASRGGLRDKPGKAADYYHTCYCLSGLAVAQHCGDVILGESDNLLPRTDPACNVLHSRLERAWRFWGA